MSVWTTTRSRTSPAFKDCYSLIQIDAWDNPLDTEKIPEASADIGIIVNYNATYEPPEETTEE